MASPSFILDNPETWLLAAEPNFELQQMILAGIKPKFSSDTKDDSLEAKRARYNALFVHDATAALSSAQGDVSLDEILIPVRDGSKIRALVYSPKCSNTDDKQQTGRPLVVLLHGGGFILGCAEMETPTCIGAVLAYGCIAVSLEYRLSPEVKFPVAYDDCWDALLWILANASTLKADPSKGFIFGGTSAGSHISIPLAHKAMDDGLQPPITGLYHAVPPALPPQALTEKYRHLYRSREALKDGMTLTSKSTDLYDQAVEPQFDSPLWAPLLWPTGHGGLPRTYFQICGSDLLRDEALIYERELRVTEKIKTRTVVYEGLPHIFWYNYPTHSASVKYQEDAVKGLGWLLRKED